jgi:hypothetical protein
VNANVKLEGICDIPNICTLSGQNITNTYQVIIGESYDPLLMSPVKSTSISVDEGEETG